MSDLREDLRTAADLPIAPVAVDAVMRRGDQLRRRRLASSIAGGAAVVAAIPLLAGVVDSRHRVELIPYPQEVATAPPDWPEPPATDSSLRPLQGTSARGVARRVAPDDAASAEVVKPASKPAAVPATAGAAPREPRRDVGTVRSDPDDPPVRQPSPPDRQPTNPAPAEGCTVSGADLKPRESASCSYTATHAGGYVAWGSVGLPPSYAPGDSDPPPDLWVIEITRGEQVIRYSDMSGGPACADAVIAARDVVTATVTRSDPEDWTGYIELRTGRGRSCDDDIDAADMPRPSPQLPDPTPELG